MLVFDLEVKDLLKLFLRHHLQLTPRWVCSISFLRWFWEYINYLFFGLKQLHLLILIFNLSFHLQKHKNLRVCDDPSFF